MLNLVQLQERLKDVPMQALMQYANGTNPQVPPFLALGELNRRKKMQEGAAAEQAAEMEGAPTVKQQIEQATGLMALQGNRQRQAAQQQAGVQAAMPMAAPNTTTSEPAQLAAGGFIDDIVVPRDYQAGGPVSPAMLQALAKARAMRRPRGLSGLPMRPDMFRRGDYAGGGIVAFQGGGSTFDEDKQEDRDGSFTIPGAYRAVKDFLFPSQQKIVEVPFELIGKIGLAQVRDIELGKHGTTREEILASFGMGPKPETRQTTSRQDNYPDESRRGSASMGIPRPSPQTTPDTQSFLERQRPSALGGLSALKKALGLDPEKYFQAKDPRSVEDIMAERKRLQGLAGISEEYLDERERRLAELQARREGVRAGQPMEQLTSFLTSIAEGPRGGTFGTQGARGARASRELRAQQEALRDKQDMEMEELKFATAAKRDAVRRGDLGEAEKLRTKEEELKRDMLKNQADLIRNQAQLETQGRQVEYYGQQVSRPTDFERQKELYLQHIRETGEKPTAAGFQKFILGSKASTVMTMEDAIRLATTQLGAGASIQEIQQRAMELMRLGAGGSAGSATLPAGVKVTREK